MTETIDSGTAPRLLIYGGDGKEKGSGGNGSRAMNGEERASRTKKNNGRHNRPTTLPVQHRNRSQPHNPLSHSMTQCRCCLRLVACTTFLTFLPCVFF